MILNKPLLILLLVSLSFSSLFGYLSYKFYGDKQEALMQLEIVKKSNLSLEQSLKKEEAACKIIDKINTELKEESLKEQETASKEIEEIDKLPAVKKAPFAANKAAEERELKDEDNVVDVDGKLPDSLRRVLQSTYSRVQGEVGSNSK